MCCARKAGHRGTSQANVTDFNSGPSNRSVNRRRVTIMSNGVNCFEAREEKLFNDCVHEHFVLPQLCVKIIDTSIFQRLRNIKQTGLVYLVFPSASHNRFEHSLGVCYLAGKMVDALNRNSLENEKKISSLEKLCLQVAGLCHDLGHGPFSHSWEKFIHKAHGNDEWKHEDMSVALFDLILENEKVREEFKYCGLEEEHKNFIKKLILGKDEEQSEKVFLFEIICNNKTGIDVDKWDYLLRDGKQLNINITFDPHRLMKCLRIIKVDGKYHICFRKKERMTILHMYMMRAELHRIAYQHPVVKMVEEMWVDALLDADANGYLFKGMKLSETQNDPAIFACLTDHIYHDILYSEDKKCTEAQVLLKRIHDRNLYKTILRHTLGNEIPERELSRIYKCTEMKKKALPPLDLYVTSFKLEMPDLTRSVFLYDKQNLNEAKSDKDWLSVPVFPYDMAHMKRVEIFYFCKGSVSSLGSTIELLRQTACDIILQCRSPQSF